MTHIRKLSAGFDTDMKTLLEKFVAAETARFTQFTKLWREMKFSLIFCGRKDPQECRVFFDEITTTILKLWRPSCSFQERVFALYMLYAVYTMQPLTPKVKIRLRLSDWKQCDELLLHAYANQHLDVCYAIHRMRLEHCFHFVACLRQRSPISVIDRGEGDDSDTLKSEVFSKVEGMCTTGSLQHLAQMHEEYMSLKAAQQCSAVRDIAMVKENIAEGIIRELSMLQAKYKVDEEEVAAGEIDDCSQESSSSEAETDIASRRKALRQQQFSSTSKTRKGERFEQLLEGTSMSDSGEASALPVTRQKSTKQKSKASTTNVP
uniref:Putative small nuclear rna activating complex snapc subunit snap43 n=1 Tax=Amblyomma aureolatum TaxID=187763 RepID=A0A1E1XCH5_9ACAR